MAFINVIKCTYKIWSRSEIICAKKIKKEKSVEPIRWARRRYHGKGPTDFIFMDF